MPSYLVRETGNSRGHVNQGSTLNLRKWPLVGATLLSKVSVLSLLHPLPALGFGSGEKHELSFLNQMESFEMGCCVSFQFQARFILF